MWTRPASCAGAPRRGPHDARAAALSALSLSRCDVGRPCAPNTSSAIAANTDITACRMLFFLCQPLFFFVSTAFVSTVQLPNKEWPFKVNLWFDPSAPGPLAHIHSCQIKLMLINLAAGSVCWRALPLPADPRARKLLFSLPNGASILHLTAARITSLTMRLRSVQWPFRNCQTQIEILIKT